ncbi:MAG TPA: hypothetical protein VKF36_23625 [Syntrophorhabdales bacterium]|nr:hypothetical protein [Syntrophorhabdales bacterium]
MLTIDGAIRPVRLAALVGMLFMVPVAQVAQPCFAADSFVLYQVGGAKEVQSWSLARDFFKGKGYDVLYQLGETTVEKHLEKMGKINRSPAKFFLALELVSGDDTGVLVVMTDRRGPEGDTSPESGGPLVSRTGKDVTTFAPDTQAGNKFLAVDELQRKYASDSARLADAMAGSFHVKVRHVPLFPLLGADMPGIFLRIECKQDKVGEMLGLLHGGIQNYLRRDVSHER